MTAERFESPSEYIPAGASFNGAGPRGIEDLIEAAGWAEALDGWSYQQAEAAVHRRVVDGETVWGIQVSGGGA